MGGRDEICLDKLLLAKDMILGFPGGSVVKNLPANAEGASSTPGLGRFPGEGNSNTRQYSFLGSPMDKGAWQAIQSMRLQRVGYD